MKRTRNPLALAYIIVVVLLSLAFIRTEMIARQVIVEDCNTFRQSQELLKDVLLLAIPEDIEQTPEMTDAEVFTLETEVERRKAFRDRLIREIDAKEC